MKAENVEYCEALAAKLFEYGIRTNYTPNEKVNEICERCVAPNFLKQLWAEHRENIIEIIAKFEKPKQLKFFENE